MLSDVVVSIENVSKCYNVNSPPLESLKQICLPRIYQSVGLSYVVQNHGYWALKDINLQILKGETIGLIGKNGSGKSTLLQLICQTLMPTTGNIYTKGRIGALLELGSGFNPEFTGRDNVITNATLLGLSRLELNKSFNSIIEFADIGDFIEQPVKTYSSGMLMRLAFSVISHIEADILVIDEALSVGDAFFSQKCMRFLRNFMETGTVIFVSHDMSAIKSLCSRVVWIEDGQVKQIGDPKEICDRYLAAVYEERQGNSAPREIKKSTASVIEECYDQRMTYINKSNLRNDIQLFEFKEDANSFGLGHACITDVVIYDDDGRRLSWIIGGEVITLKITARAVREIKSPIIGFFVKDRLGQSLFGDNTFLNYENDNLIVEEGDEIEAKFEFRMPRLQRGDYSITVSVAAGSQKDHIQHQWIYDALFFRSEVTSVAGCMIGIPIRKINLEIIKY